MPEQEQVKRVSPKDAEEMAEKDAQRVYESEKDKAARVKAKGEELTDDIDAMLDEIDTLLEEQEVLVNFRQKGGQRWTGYRQLPVVYGNGEIREACALRRSRSPHRPWEMDD